MILHVLTLSLGLLATQVPAAPEAKPAPGLATAAKPAPKPKAKAKPAPPRRKPRTTDYSKQLDLNSATLAQLAALPGVNAEVAQRIVAGRPYYSKAKLNSGILPPGSYAALKDKVKAVPPGLPPKAK